MNKKKNKTFDCVEFKRKAQSHIYKDIAPLNARDQAAYFESLATQGSLGRWWKTVRRARRPAETGRAQRCRAAGAVSRSAGIHNDR